MKKNAIFKIIRLFKFIATLDTIKNMNNLICREKLFSFHGFTQIESGHCDRDFLTVFSFYENILHFQVCMRKFTNLLFLTQRGKK